MRSGSCFLVDEVVETTIIIALGIISLIVNWVLGVSMFTLIDLVEDFSELYDTKSLLKELGREETTFSAISLGFESWML